MSTWTHVAGVIRIDAFPLEQVYDWDEILGHQRLFDDEPVSGFMLPEGSEGTLTKVIDKNRDPNHLAAFTVMFYGDLRDYDSLPSFKVWLDQVCLNIKNAVFRQGSFQFWTDPVKHYWGRKEGHT